MIRNVVEGIGGVGNYGVISICLFFAVFTGALIWAFTQRKAHCEKMRALPLEDGSREVKGDYE